MSYGINIQSTSNLIGAPVSSGYNWSATGFGLGQVDWTRVLGGVQMVGGVIEAVVGGVGGILTAETGVGAAAGYAMVLNGIDNAVAGARTMWNGENAQTMLHQGVYHSASAMGASDGVAEGIATGADISTIFLGNGAAVKNAYSGLKNVNFADNLKSLWHSGKTFEEFKAARGGTETLDFISTTNRNGRIVSQRVSTEFAHIFIPQRMQRAYNLPNWMVHNRINVWKLNTIQHTLIDSYRFNFLRRGIKPEVGWFKKYNWFTKF